MEILVDSTIYISLLRQGRDPRHELAAWAASGRMHGCGVIRAEVLRGCRHTGVRDDLAAFFDLLPEPVMDGEFWRGVADLGWRLDRQGEVLPLTDLAISLVATRLGAVVVTTDPHFSRVPGVQVFAGIPPLS